MGQPNRLIRALLYGCAAFCAAVTVAPAKGQDPYKIRIESDQILVPAFVFEKTPATGQIKDWQDEAGRTLISDLRADEFRLFEDGVEQKIESVTLEATRSRVVRDDAYCHVEVYSPPAARWSSGQYEHGSCPPIINGNYYDIAYAPPPAPVDSCHHVTVTVNRPKAVAYTRSEYCRTPYSTSDELNGTRAGKWMEKQLALEKPGDLQLSLQIGTLYAGGAAPLIHVAVELPWQSVKTEWMNGRLWAWYRVLGMVYRQGGALAERFSEARHFDVLPPAGVEPGPDAVQYYSTTVRLLPYRYERQIHLSPGSYELVLLFSDGVRFGSARTALAVGPSDPNELGISSVMLGKRYQRAPSSEGNQRPKLPGGFVPLVSRDIEVTPSGSTRFKHGQPIIAYLEVYRPTSASSDRQDQPSVQIHLRIVDTGSGDVREAYQAVDAGPYLLAGSTVIPIEREIPTTKLKRGSYRLEVQATDSVGRRTVVRGTSFTID